jgi:hypothetical protein
MLHPRQMGQWLFTGSQEVPLIQRIIEKGTFSKLV